MQSNGVIRGFRGYTPAQLEQMKKDLSLSMSPQRIAYCAGYYRSVARDPMLCEMEMLDRYVAAQARLASCFAPITLTMHESYLANTYADMMQKRRVLSPNAKVPCTVLEALGLTTSYLAYAGKAPQLADLYPILENKRLSHKGYKSLAISTLGADYGLRLTEGSGAKAASNDMLLLLLPNAGAALPQDTEQKHAFLEDKQLKDRIVSLTTVGEGGLLQTLLAMSDGMLIDLPHLSRTGEPIPLTMLADGFVGYELVRLAPASVDAFVKQAKAYGISAMPFAQLLAGTTFTVKSGTFGGISLESGFLRALAPIRTTNATLTEDGPYRPAEISHMPISKGNCKYLKASSSERSLQLVANGHTLAAVASCTAENDFFRNTIDCALVPILILAASGCSYTDMRMALGLTLPLAEDGEQDHAPTLATVMGLYRFSAELGIPIASRMTDTDPARKVPHLSVFAYGNGNARNASFEGVSHFVHCFIPNYLPNGLLDFAALRQDLRKLTELSESGKLVSARVLARKDLMQGLKEMSTDQITCKIEKPQTVFEASPPVAILLETTERLGFGYIGKAQENTLPRTEQKTLPRLSKASFLLPNDLNEVLLLARAFDDCAQLLSNALTERGAAVRLMDPKEESTPSLNRAILAARTLILCDGVTLPIEERIEFALKTLCSAGGWILATPHAKCDYDIPVVKLDSGFDEELLQQICKMEENI